MKLINLRIFEDVNISAMAGQRRDSAKRLLFMNDQETTTTTFPQVQDTHSIRGFALRDTPKNLNYGFSSLVTGGPKDLQLWFHTPPIRTPRKHNTLPPKFHPAIYLKYLGIIA